jgi:hypothetical protein
MKSDQLDIWNKDPGAGPLFVGTVRLSNQARDLEFIGLLIRNAWAVFQQTEPDCDSEFIPYLTNGWPDYFQAGDEHNHLILN